MSLRSITSAASNPHTPARGSSALSPASSPRTLPSSATPSPTISPSAAPPHTTSTAAMPNLSPLTAAATRTPRKSRPDALTLSSGTSFKAPGKTPRTPKTPTTGLAGIALSPRSSAFPPGSAGPSATDLVVEFYSFPSPRRPPPSATFPRAPGASGSGDSGEEIPPVPVASVAVTHGADGRRLATSSTSGADAPAPIGDDANVGVSSTRSSDLGSNASSGVDPALLQASVPDLSFTECQTMGLQKLLVSRIPLCYFLGHHLDTFAPENLFFILDVILFQTHPAVVFDTYLAQSAPLELNLPEPKRLAALEAWGMSDPAACFEAVREGVMGMLEESWIAYKKSSAWRSLVADHASRVAPTNESGEPDAGAVAAGVVMYTPIDVHTAVAHMVSMLNKRYPASAATNSAGASSKSRNLSSSKSRRMGLAPNAGGGGGGGTSSHGASDSDDTDVSPHRLIRRKAALFAEHCCLGNVPDAIAANLYAGKRRTKAAKRAAAAHDGSSVVSTGSGGSGAKEKGNGFLKLFGFGKKK
ncbi:hypothetical protein BC828DRAFT_378630 [Blastocladiella britannica]|nr:hypothetical protein BC828DRAFT_378630 [Blastocladiella britannica]